MSKKKKRSIPAAAPAEPAKAEHTQPEEPAVSSTARWMATICAALGFVPVLEQVALSLTLLVDVLSLVGLITALRRQAAPLPFIGLLVVRFHPF